MAHDASGTAAAVIQLKRAYDAPASGDGVRVLVDRLWPRGVAKEEAALAAWMAALGPSDALRSWFGHQPERWPAFTEKYRGELATPLRQTLLASLQGVAGRSSLTLVYAARDTRQNEAVVLRHYLLQERARPAAWEVQRTLLLVMAVVAAARPDAVAAAAGVDLFASPLLTAGEIATARETLLASGDVRAVSGGWTLTPRARKEVRELQRASATAAG